MKRMIILPTSIFEPAMLFSLLGVVLLVISIILLRRKYSAMWFFAIWFFIFLFPQSGIYPINAFVADHFLYIPCIGFFFVFTALLKKTFTGRKFYYVVLLFLLFFGVTTFIQNEIWNNRESLYKHILRLSPDSWEAHNNLGKFYQDNGRQEEALAEFQKAIKFNDQSFTVHANIGNIYYGLGQYEKALEKYEEISRKFPQEDLTNIHNSKGACYANLKRYDEALREFRYALSTKPNLPSVHFNMAKMFIEQNKNKEAIKEILSVLEPNIKVSDLMKLDKPSLREYLEIVKTKDCIMNALLGLGIVFSRYSLWDYAKKAFQKAAEIDPEYADAYYNLGALYFRMGNFAGAEQMWRKTLKLKPDHIYAKEQLFNLKKRQYLDKSN
jgi:tetratricopeptide (TPR) repeat protein